MIGQVVGNYKIVEYVAEGGMGVVYRAEHTMIGKSAAVKVLLEELSTKREVVDRFFTEARATTGIQHPGIIDIFDFGYHTDGRAYIVMEFLHGEPLADRLERIGKLPVDQALSITRAVASAVAAAHRNGVIHRDLKPDNIFLVPDPDMPTGERVKVLDFGIAKLADSGSGKPSLKTRTGAMMGTPTYMSPEQCKGAGAVDARSDVYAVGCILFELLTGRPPFVGEGFGEIIAAHLTEEPPSVQALEPSVPDHVAQVVAGMLVKDPNRRYQSLDEVKQALGGRATPVAGVAVAAGPTASGPVATPVTGPGLPGRASEPTTLGGSASQAYPTADGGGGKKGLLIGAGLLVLVVAAGGGFLLASGGAGDGDAEEPVAAAPAELEPAPEPAEAAPEPAPTPTPTPAAPKKVTIKLAIEPAGARVEVDGAVRIDNPLILTQGDATHQVVVSKKGYESKELTVSAVASGEIPVVLEKKRRSRTRPKARPKPRPKPKPKRPKGPLEVDL